MNDFFEQKSLDDPVVVKNLNWLRKHSGIKAAELAKYHDELRAFLLEQDMPEVAVDETNFSYKLMSEEDCVPLKNHQKMTSIENGQGVSLKSLMILAIVLDLKKFSDFWLKPEKFQVQYRFYSKRRYCGRAKNNK